MTSFEIKDLDDYTWEFTIKDVTINDFTHSYEDFISTNNFFDIESFGKEKLIIIYLYRDNLISFKLFKELMQ